MGRAEVVRKAKTIITVEERDEPKRKRARGCEKAGARRRRKSQGKLQAKLGTRKRKTRRTKPLLSNLPLTMTLAKSPQKMTSSNLRTALE
jgi:hypothetical protein